jgi:hypothetical protein
MSLLLVPLAANQPRIPLPGGERQHIQHSFRRQPELHPIRAQRITDPEGTTQLRQRPAQCAARIVGLAEDEHGQLRAGDRPLRQGTYASTAHAFRPRGGATRTPSRSISGDPSKRTSVDMAVRS